MVADDEHAQDATADAFDALHYVAGKRLAGGRLTVVDATNVHREDRAELVRLARVHHVLAVAIVLDLPVAVCHQRNRSRADRGVPPQAIQQQAGSLRRSLRSLQKKEGFHHVHRLNTPEEVEDVSIDRQPLWTDRREHTGPFDLIGDVHGCHEELVALLGALGYGVTDAEVRPPPGRTAVFLGDLVDRGPATPAVLRLVMGMVGEGTALCVPGNHDVKLIRALRGRKVRVSHGLAQSLEQLAAEPEDFRSEVAAFIDGLVSHYVLDGGRLVVAHAGLKREYHNRASRTVRDFALYGETTGETDEFGLPVRADWAAGYRGEATVVYGHTPVPEPEWVNRTINIDTGCVFGGRLTALRWPERELVSVPAARTYYEPIKPLSASGPVGAPAAPVERPLDINDVLGKRIVETRLLGKVTVRGERAAAALEVMSRFALDPRWLVYLPPTMAPCATSGDADLLEHPREAFAYYRQQGLREVVCEEKHMGSRAVIVLTRDDEGGARRFAAAGTGACYTRTGRRFFIDAELEAAVLGRLRAAAERAALWQELDSDWLCLDAEVLPWSAKAQGLITEQFAAVGTAAQAGLAGAVDALERAASRGVDVNGLLERHRSRAEAADGYVRAYQRYVWPVNGIDDLRIAPFQLLASQGAAQVDADHRWHLQIAARLAAADPALMIPTGQMTVDLADEDSEAAATAWWESVTACGGEGMVVKPLGGIARGPKGLVQPALKCRGREYLRLIYGPEYTAHLDRLRERALGPKRALALREFALGVEALERHVRGEPAYRVHECVFAVLALESEPVDPRL